MMRKLTRQMSKSLILGEILRQTREGLDIGVLILGATVALIGIFSTVRNIVNYKKCISGEVDQFNVTTLMPTNGQINVGCAQIAIGVVLILHNISHLIG